MNLDYELLEHCLRDPRNVPRTENSSTTTDYGLQRELAYERRILGGTPLWENRKEKERLYASCGMDDFLTGDTDFLSGTVDGNTKFSSLKMELDDIPALLHYMKDDSAIEAERRLWDSVEDRAGKTATNRGWRSSINIPVTETRVCPPIPRHLAPSVDPSTFEPRLPSHPHNLCFVSNPELRKKAVAAAVHSLEPHGVVYVLAQIDPELRAKVRSVLRNDVSKKLTDLRIKDMHSAVATYSLWSLYEDNPLELVYKIVGDQGSRVNLLFYLTVEGASPVAYQRGLRLLGKDPQQLARFTRHLDVDALVSVADRSSEVRDGNLIEYLYHLPWRVLAKAEERDANYKSKLRPFFANSLGNRLLVDCLEPHEKRPEPQPDVTEGIRELTPEIAYENWVRWAEPRVRVRREFLAVKKLMRELVAKYEAPDFLRDFMVLWAIRPPGGDWISPTLELWASRQPPLPLDVVDCIERLRELHALTTAK